MVILIDDDTSSLVSLEAMCEELQLVFRSFSSPIEGIKFLNEAASDKISLLICDYKMPEMNGLELIKEAQANHKNLACILITAHDSSPIAVEALELGAYDYITKPINFKELSIVVKRAIRQKEIREENIRLAKRLKQFEDIGQTFIGKSQAVEEIKQVIKKVAKTNANILITGETGTGKEVIAKAIHEQSNRGKKEMVNINCASIPANLLESELFGHKKGAFTGATQDKLGLFEIANEGILFLDEIGDMPFELQSKLLRAIQEGKIRSVGDNKEKSVDVRIIAATHNNLIQKIKENKFREDLYYRLNVINIVPPPVRDRKEDIPLLANYFLKKHQKIHNSSARNFSSEAIDKLMNYPWPGNVRELENVVERACILATGKELLDSDILTENSSNAESFTSTSFEKLLSMQEIEREYIRYVLGKAENVKDKGAGILGINRKTLYRKIKEYGIE